LRATRRSRWRELSWPSNGRARDYPGTVFPPAEQPRHRDRLFATACHRMSQLRVSALMQIAGPGRGVPIPRREHGWSTAPGARAPSRWRPLPEVWGRRRTSTEPTTSTATVVRSTGEDHNPLSGPNFQQALKALAAGRLLTSSFDVHTGDSSAAIPAKEITRKPMSALLGTKSPPGRPPTQGDVAPASR